MGRWFSRPGVHFLRARRFGRRRSSNACPFVESESAVALRRICDYMRDMSPSTAKRSHMSTKTPKTIEADVLAWLDQVVIGLNLCPFAARPRRLGQIRVVVSNARDDDGLIDELARAACFSEQASETIETSLLVVPDMLEDFEPYNHFVAVAEMLVRQYGWEGQPGSPAFTRTTV